MRRLCVMNNALRRCSGYLFLFDVGQRAIRLPGILFSSKQYGNRFYGRDNTRSFTPEDEVKLTQVVLQSPSHVVEHVRESMKRSPRRVIHFRNCVTYVAIILQSRLHAKTISPQDSSLIMEGLLKECMVLKQSDLAHLLFRAALRFNAFGTVARPSFVKLLYQSYRGNKGGERVIKNIADELKGKEMHSMAAIGYCLAGDSSGIDCFPFSSATAEDVVVLIECCGLVGWYHAVYNILVRLVVEKPLASNTPERNTFFSVAICSCSGSNETTQKIIELGKQHGIHFSDAAGAAAIVFALQSVDTLQQVQMTEKALEKDMHIPHSSPLISCAVVTKCVDLFLRHSYVEDPAYLSEKVDAIFTYIDGHRERTNDDTGTTMIVTMIKGYGALHNYEKMGRVFQMYQKCPLPGVHRIYEEALRWYSYAKNVKEALAVKEAMSQEHIYHTVHTYQYLFRALDTSHPQLAEKYFKEMRGKGIRLDGHITTILIRTFSANEDWGRVESLYSESKRMALNGSDNSFSSRLVIQMLRCYQGNAERCKDIIKDAGKFGLLDDGTVQAECVHSLSTNLEEMNNFLLQIQNKSNQTYRSLIKLATRKASREEFDRLIADIESNVKTWDERLVVAVISAYARFNDMEGVKKFVDFAHSRRLVQSPLFFADVASAFAKLGALDESDNCWQMMLSSGMPVTMPAFNKFLDLYMTQQDIKKVQEILDTIMRLIPPNPVTATSVMNMLGRMGRLQEMEAVLDSMYASSNAAPTLASLHAALSAYARVGNVEKMEGIRQRIKSDGFSESEATFNILFEGYGKAKRFARIHELVQERARAGIKMDETGYVTLLGIYSRERLNDDVEQLVKQIVSSGETLSNKLLAYIAAAYAFINNTANMEKFIKMLLDHPNCGTRDLEMVFMMYGKFRDTMRLQQLLDKCRDKVSAKMYNISVTAFAKAGEYTKVAALLDEMERRNYLLNRTTSILLSSLLVKAGKPELAQALLKSTESPDPHIADDEEDCAGEEGGNMSHTESSEDFFA